MKAIDRREPDITELQTYTIQKSAVEVLAQLRESEPQIVTVPPKHIPIEEMSLADLLPIAPTAVLGTLLPYAKTHGMHSIDPACVRISFATTHAQTVAHADEITTSFRLGIRVDKVQNGLFTFIHTLTPATVANSTVTAMADSHTLHRGVCDPKNLMLLADYVALHCGSVICMLSEAEATAIAKMQTTMQDLFGQLPPSIDYTQEFGGVFVTKQV